MISGMEITFQDKVVIVTGGAKGIGRAIGLAFAQAGARMVVADIDVAAAEATAEELRPFGQDCMHIAVDVADPAACTRLAGAAVERFGAIDVLVNNAGISQPQASVDMPPELWDRIIGIDLSGAFFCSQAVARHMIPRGSGAIISISSIAGYVGFPGRAPYCAAKAGLIALTQVLGCEWAAHGIRVNAVAPGYVMTELVEKNVERGIVSLAAVERRTPLGRIATPDDVARAVLMLASDQAAYVTGQTLPVDGGWTAYGGW